MICRGWRLGRAMRVTDALAGVGFRDWEAQRVRRKEQLAQGVGYEGSGGRDWFEC